MPTTGKKVSEKPLPKKENLKPLTSLENRKFVPNQEFINQINRAQSSWKAVVYDKYRGMTVAQLTARAGGPKKLNFPKPARLVEHHCILYQVYDMYGNDSS